MLHSISINNIIPHVIDVGVVSNDFIILGEEEEGHSPFITELDDSHVAHMLAMA